MNSKLSQILLVAPLLIASSTAFAQNAATTKFVPDQNELEIESIENIEARNRLDGTLSASANINLVHNSDVVGQVDGLSTIFGVGLIAGLDWIHGRHELRNTLRINESWAYTPNLPKFVKNNDLVTLSSQYNYFFLDWMGAFGRLSFETAIFPTIDYRNEEYTYDIDGKTQTKDKELKISGAFKPFSMAQSIGIVSDPLRADWLNLSARLGVGGRETLAKGVLSIGKVNDTAKTIEVKTLDNVYQFGLEAFVGGSGKFQEGRISYDFGLSVLIPFANNAPAKTNGKKPSAFALTRVGLGTNVNFAVFSWMGITYKLFLLRDPQLLDKIQIQNSILATFNYTFLDRDFSKTATEEEVAAAEAEAEKKAAEKRAKEAEARAKAAEEQAKQAEQQAKQAEAAAQSASQDAEEAAVAAEKVPAKPVPAEPTPPPSEETGSQPKAPAAPAAN